MFQKEIERYYCFIDDINNEIKINILKFRNISLIFRPKQKQLNSLKTELNFYKQTDAITNPYKIIHLNDASLF